MSASVFIDYRLGEHGWSSFTLTIGDTSIEIGDFGYCTDALGDLVRAALVIAASGLRANASFDGEPREWRLIVERVSGVGCYPTEVCVSVTTWSVAASSDERHEKTDGPAADSLKLRAELNPEWILSVVPLPVTHGAVAVEHVTVFEARTEADAFAKAVLTAAQNILDEHGIDGYDRAWLPISNGFPLRAVRALAEALSIREPLVRNS